MTTIVSRSKIRFAVIRSLRLGASREEAVATVAQIFHLPVEEVEACCNEEADKEVFA